MRPRRPSPYDLQMFREVYGLTQAACAELADVNVRTWQRCEYGVSQLNGAAWAYVKLRARIDRRRADAARSGS